MKKRLGSQQQATVDSLCSGRKDRSRKRICKSTKNVMLRSCLEVPRKSIKMLIQWEHLITQFLLICNFYDRLERLWSRFWTRLAEGFTIARDSPTTAVLDPDFQTCTTEIPLDLARQLIHLKSSLKSISINRHIAFHPPPHPKRTLHNWTHIAIFQAGSPKQGTTSLLSRWKATLLAEIEDLLDSECVSSSSTPLVTVRAITKAVKYRESTEVYIVLCGRKVLNCS